MGKELVCLPPSILRDAIAISSEAFSLLLVIRAQGNITGQLENKTCLMQFESCGGFFFFHLVETKIPV